MKQKALNGTLNLGDYFLSLLNDLNHYEGSSLHFDHINIDFINYLKVSFIYLDNQAKKDILAKFTKETIYKKHPFLPIIIDILDGKHIRGGKWDLLQTAINQNKKYPLVPFINLITKYLSNDKSSIKVIHRELKKGNLLLFIYCLNHHFIGFKHEEKISLLTFYSASGLSYATYLLAAEAVRKGDVDDAKRKLVFTARQSGKNAIDFVGEESYRLAKQFAHENKISGELLKLAADLDYENAFMPLIEYYENALELGEDRFAYAFYYLSIASFKYIKAAQRKLITYYEKGIYIPKSRRLAQDFKDILND